MRELELYHDARRVAYIDTSNVKDLFYVFLTEECSELIQEICKAERGKLDKSKMEGEIADVIISLERFLIKYKEDCPQKSKVAIAMLSRFESRATIEQDTITSRQTIPEIKRHLISLMYNASAIGTEICTDGVTLISKNVDCVIAGLSSLIRIYELSLGRITENYTSTITKIVEGLK